MPDLPFPTTTSRPSKMWRTALNQRNKRRIESPPPDANEPAVSINTNNASASPSQDISTKTIATIHTGYPTDIKRPRLIPTQEASPQSAASSLTPLSRSQTPVAPPPQPTQSHLPSPPTTASILPSADQAASHSTPRGDHEAAPSLPDMVVDLHDGPDEQLKALQMEALDLKRDRAYQQDGIDEQRRELERLRPTEANGSGMDATEDKQDDAHLLHTRAYFTHALFYSMIMGSDSSPHTLGIADQLARFIHSLLDGTRTNPETVTSAQLLNDAWNVLQQLQSTLSTLDNDSFGATLSDWRNGLLVPPPKDAIDRGDYGEAGVLREAMDVDGTEADPMIEKQGTKIEDPTSRRIGVTTTPVPDPPSSSDTMDQDNAGDSPQSEDDSDEHIQELLGHIANLRGELQREKTAAEGARRQVQVLETRLAKTEAAANDVAIRLAARSTLEADRSSRSERLPSSDEDTKGRIRELQDAESAAQVELERQRLVAQNKARMLEEEIQRTCNLERELQRERDMIKNQQQEIKQRDEAFYMLSHEKSRVDAILRDAVKLGTIGFRPGPDGQSEVCWFRTASNPVQPALPNAPHVGHQSTQHSPSGPSRSRQSSGNHSARSTEKHPLSQPTQALPIAGPSRPLPVPYHPAAAPGPVSTTQQSIDRMEALQRQQRHMEKARQIGAQQNYRAAMAGAQSATYTGQVPHALPQYPLQQPPSGQSHHPHHATLDAHLGNQPMGYSSGPQPQIQQYTQPHARAFTTQQSGAEEMAAVYSQYPLSPSPPLVSIDDRSQPQPPTPRVDHGLAPKQERTATPAQYGGQAISASGPAAGSNTAHPANPPIHPEAGPAEDPTLRAAVDMLAKFGSNQHISSSNAPSTSYAQPPQPSTGSSSATGQASASLPRWRTSVDTSASNSVGQAQAQPNSLISAARQQVQNSQQPVQTQQRPTAPQTLNRFAASVWKGGEWDKCAQ